jgi:trimethylamine--corrinoid protein Co-methyltransferase
MLSVLSKEEVEKIHFSALEILERTGIIIEHPKALLSLKEAGATVDPAKSLARFPPYVINEHVAKAPPHFLLSGRNARFDFIVRNGSLFARSLSGCSHVLDMDSGQCREATTKDTAEGARILDALDNIHYCGGWIYPGDEHPSYRDVSLFKIFVENSEKHITLQAYEGKNLEFMIEMAEAVQGGEDELRRRPLLSVILAPTSPLKLGKFMIDQIYLAGQHGFPALIGSTPIAGATSPVTLAGDLVIVHCENLAAIALSQILHPGTPVIYGPRPNTMDMRTGNAVWGSIEFGILSAASVQLGHFCGLPVDTYSLGTDSKALDEQAAVERSLNLIFPVLAGVNLLTGAGFIETIRTASFPQIVIDNEILGMVYKARKGIRVDDESMALDLISKVGPGGNYLAEKHTREHALSAHFMPSIFDRNVRQVWEQKGSKDAIEVAKQRVREILKRHHPAELSNDVQKELESIMARAKRTLCRD